MKLDNDSWVRKSVALGLLISHGRAIDTGQFARGLERLGFDIDLKDVARAARVYNLLQRLWRQGLIRKLEEQRELTYGVKEKAGRSYRVTRSQAIVLWEITPKGEARFKYLQSVNGLKNEKEGPVGSST